MNYGSTANNPPTNPTEIPELNDSPELEEIALARLQKSPLHTQIQEYLNSDKSNKP